MEIKKEKKEEQEIKDKPITDESLCSNDTDYDIKHEPTLKLEPSVTDTGKEDVVAKTRKKRAVEDDESGKSNKLQRVPHVTSPQRPGTSRQTVVNVRPGVIQQTEQTHQSHQYVQRYPQPQQQGVMVHNTAVSSGQQWRPAQQRLNSPRPVLPMQSVQRPPVNSRPTLNPANIAYDVEHVFVENGKEVRKMPVLINGETVWVECVPNSPSVEQQEAEIMMELGAEEAGDQAGPAVKIISTSQ